MDDLVRTAELMRERANAAQPGPWTLDRWDSIAGPSAAVLVPHLNGARTGLTRLAVLGSQDAADAEYIASMQPAVAYAVADLLDVIGEILSGRAMPDAALEVAARDVARAYLPAGPGQ